MRYYFFIGLFFLIVNSSAQTIPIAERRISFEATNQSLPVIFKKIELQADCRFSYPSGLIATSQPVTINVKEKSVRQVLDILLPANVSWQVKSNYIILTKKPVQEKRSSSMIISGYIYDLSNDSVINNASISVTSRMVNTASNEYGYFRLKLDEPATALRMKVYKQNYYDTLLTIAANRNIEVQVKLRKLDTIEVAVPGEPPLSNIILPELTVINAQNISDTTYHDWQLGILPGIGMYDEQNANSINKYSLNLLGGYSLGTDGAEVAGLFNLTRGNVKWFQAAGLLNGTGGNVLGGQFAGFGNVVAGSVTGIQASGFTNLVRDSIFGAQVSGYFNLVRKKANGFQVSGFANAMLDTSMGAQLSGFTNYAHRSFTGVQMSGFANTVLDTLKGAQIGGFLSFTNRQMKGAQITGFANMAIEDVDGFQLAGFFNYTKRLKGVQIGLFNYSDTCIGVPIGLISFVNQGYHKIELGTDELNYAQLGFRSGLSKFHTQLFAGIRPENADSISWNFGWGIGTSPRLSKNLSLDVELNARQLVYGNDVSKIDLVTNLSVGLNWQISKWLAIATGPQVSAGIRDSDYSGYRNRFDIFQPSIIASETYQSTLVDVWLGWKAGIRFL